MNLHTIFTGGTIGSFLGDNDLISTDKGSPYKLINFYKKNYANATTINFTSSNPYTLLSENLDGDHLNLLIKEVSKVLENEELDGIIVTHGTDTLQYSAAVLGYIFNDARIPIILVSSDFVLEDKRANGLINYHVAVEFMKAKLGKGVFVSYCNKGGIPTIHRATRLEPPVTLSADVESVKKNHYAIYLNDTFELNDQYKSDDKNLESFTKLGLEAKDIILTNQSSEVMRIRPYVGMTYPDLDDYIENLAQDNIINEEEGHEKFSNCLEAILIESFHSGTIHVTKELEELTNRAKELNIPVYITGLSNSEKAYETVEEYRKLGIIPLRESSIISQYCKLWLAASNGLNVREIMNCSIAEDWV